MDIVFKCPSCDQELEVDAAGAGSTIECPACANSISVPIPETDPAAPAPPPVPQPPPEKHFVVPVRTTGQTEMLIRKAARPLDVVAKDGDKTLRIKTFKHTECQEVGHDHFDEVVSNFLEKVGQANIVSVNPINYSYVELGSRAIVTDFGVMIVFKG